MKLINSKEKRGLRRLLKKDASTPINGLGHGKAFPLAAVQHFVKISSTTQTSSRYPGSVYVRTGNDQSWETLQTCWLEEPNSGPLYTDIYYPVQPVGFLVSDGLPIFSTVRWFTKAAWIEFTLPGTLATTDASIASCTVNNYAMGTNPGASVTVYNKAASTNYIFSGIGGDKGIALYDDRADRYVMAQLEC